MAEHLQRTGTLFQVTALLNMSFVILTPQCLSSLSKNEDSSTSLPHKDVSGTNIAKCSSTVMMGMMSVP